MHRKAVFITGTDTEAGKTIFCAQLLAYLRTKGLAAVSQKWVQTGFSDSNDIELHLKTAGIEQPEPIDLVVPQRYEYPASPHLAARLEHSSVNVNAIENALTQLCAKYELVICEGSGGALVPLTDDLLISDFAARLGLPAVIVSANKLGCINHTLMTVEALRSRRMPILGIVFTRTSAQSDDVIMKDNIDTIRRISGERVLGEISWLERVDQYSPGFDPIGEAFLMTWSEFIGRAD